MNNPNRCQSNEANGLRNSNQSSARARKPQPKPSSKGVGRAASNSPSVGAGNQPARREASGEAAANIIPFPGCSIRPQEVAIQLALFCRHLLATGRITFAGILVKTAEEIAQLEAAESRSVL